jgi:hypothetical protein
MAALARRFLTAARQRCRLTPVFNPKLSAHSRQKEHTMRSVLGAVLGYIAMFLIVFITLTASYFALGTERAFESNSYQVSPLWWSIMLIFSFIAAVVGGKVCRRIAGKQGSVIPLVAFVLVLGAASAVPALMASSGDVVVRTGNVALMEAMSNARQPTLVTLLLPLVAAIGVVMGGRKKEP